MLVGRKLIHLSLFFFIIGYLSIAKANANETSNAVLNFDMEVVNITCVINGGNGINQQVNIPLASIDDLKNGTAKSARAALTIDCSGNADIPSEVMISLIPIGNGPVVGSGIEGILTTSLKNLGLKIVWENSNQLVSLAPGNVIKFSPTSSDLLRWELGLIVTPVIINGEPLDGGDYKSALQVIIKYT